MTLFRIDSVVLLREKTGLESFFFDFLHRLIEKENRGDRDRD